MYCGDTYNAAHAAVCTKRPQAQVHALAINDLDQPLSEEVLTQLAVEDAISDDFQQLSLNAISGTAHGEVLKLKARVQNKVMLILLDSGSSHSFVSPSFLQAVGISAVPVSPKKVQVANGQLLFSDQAVPDLQWWCQGHTFTSYMQVLQLGGYDAILGCDWLKLHSPMTCYWDEHKVEFCHQGKAIQLAGVQSPPLTLSAISATSLMKLSKGNDLWAMAIVNFVEQSTSSPLPELEALLEEFDDVFAKPTTLPPAEFMIILFH